MSPFQQCERKEEAVGDDDIKLEGEDALFQYQQEKQEDFHFVGVILPRQREYRKGKERIVAQIPDERTQPLG